MTKGRTHDIPHVCIDYAFMNDDKDKREDKEKGMPIIMMKDKELTVRYARVVPKQGVNAYAVDRIKERP